ncbi:hypothetical protein GMST_32850 [Geomonas silvestris]|uniref:Uncharacterized protein n=1 Tax=Geomonas silvestris TaxID=2740184 RepID=A0A6V8MLQ7_9BACT|nr:hypothetical protein GMST_32850 [Geomonas silvestris]
MPLSMMSTAKQGASGLGLEAQHETVRQYLGGCEWELLKEFVEVESRKNNDRPRTRQVLKHCQPTGTTP